MDDAELIGFYVMRTILDEMRPKNSRTRARTHTHAQRERERERERDCYYFLVFIY